MMPCVVVAGAVCGLSAEDVWGDEGGATGAHVLGAVLAAMPAGAPPAADSGQVSPHCAATRHRPGVCQHTAST